MSPTDRTQYREMVAAVAAKAKAILPTQVNGRIEKAVRFVLAGDVQPQPDGTIVVFSASDPTRRYVLQGTSCTCADFERGQAPEGWCAHRISAGIQKRVEQEMAAHSTAVLSEPAEEVILPGPMEVYPDNDIEEAPMPPTPVPTAPLPEAPVSITLKASFDGQEVLVTLRGTDFASVKAQVEDASAWLKAHAPAPPPALPQGKEQGWCPVHQVTMQENHKENRTWLSHRTADGAWCKGKGVRT